MGRYFANSGRLLRCLHGFGTNPSVNRIGRTAVNKSIQAQHTGEYYTAGFHHFALHPHRSTKGPIIQVSEVQDRSRQRLTSFALDTSLLPLYRNMDDS